MPKAKAKLASGQKKTASEKKRYKILAGNRCYTVLNEDAASQSAEVRVLIGKL